MPASPACLPAFLSASLPVYLPARLESCSLISPIIFQSEDFFFQLGDRRHSLHLEHSPTEGSKPQWVEGQWEGGRPNFGSEPNLQIMSSLPKTVASPRSCGLETPLDTDDESESSEPETSAATTTTTTSDTAGQAVAQGPHLMSSPLTASTQSLSSNTPSETDTIDLNSSHTSSALQHLSQALLTLQVSSIV